MTDPTRPAHRADLAKCVMCDDPATQTDTAGRWDDGVKWGAPPVCDQHADDIRLTGNSRYVYHRDHTDAHYETPVPRHRADPVPDGLIDRCTDTVDGVAC